MNLANERHVVVAPPGRDRLRIFARALRSALGDRAYPLRFSIVDERDGDLHVDATVVRWEPGEPYADEFSDLEIERPRRSRGARFPFGVVQVVPTGIRCEFGGYAGDATPATNLLAASADFLVTHPNAVNASDINEMSANVLYVEGKSLDDFLLGRIALRRTIANRVGTFFDPAGAELLDAVVHALNAAKAAAGIACSGLVSTERSVDASVQWTDAGCASGTLGDPAAALEAVARLIEGGADAVGGVSVIHGVTHEMCERHMRGEIPNPSGAVEAILTHLISKVFRIPCAHAPLPYFEDIKVRSTHNPRASAEFISTPHYFSVLKGLSRAPRLECLDPDENPGEDVIAVENIGAVVMPASALGGVPALAAQHQQIPIIAVRENKTILDMTAQRLSLSGVIEVQSYLEATGVVTALANGIAIESLRRPLERPRDL